MTTEIDPWQFKCNACWKIIDASKSYRTRCNHMYCRTCAERFFSKAMICPVCDRDVDGEFGVVELCHDIDSDIMTLFFSFVCVHNTEAINLLSESNKFIREQLALYGTREAYMRHEENKSLADEVKKCHTQLRTYAEENAALTRKIEDSAHLLKEKDRQLKHALDAYNSLKGSTATPLASRRSSDSSVSSSATTDTRGSAAMRAGGSSPLHGSAAMLHSISSGRPMMSSNGIPGTPLSSAMSGSAISGSAVQKPREFTRPRSGEPVPTSTYLSSIRNAKHVLATPSRTPVKPLSSPGGYLQTKQGSMRLVQRPATGSTTAETPRR